MLSFLFFIAFQVVQAWQVYSAGIPLASYFILTMNSSIVSIGVLIDSIGIVAYLILFSLPAMVLGNRYSRALGSAAVALSIWLYWSTFQSIFFLFSHGNTGYHYFGYLPFSPYYGGLGGLLVNYKIPPYDVYTDRYLYLILSGLLFFASYFMAFAVKSSYSTDPTVD